MFKYHDTNRTKMVFIDENVKKISGLNQIVKINENVDVVIATGAETVSVCKRYFQNQEKYI